MDGRRVKDNARDACAPFGFGLRRIFPPKAFAFFGTSTIDARRAAHGLHTDLPTGGTMTRGKTGAQGGEKAHHLLHTGYKQIDVYKFA